MLKLSPAQRRELREQAHHLDPVVMVGENGLTDGVLREISSSLDAHGLIKIRVFGDDRTNRIEMYQAICAGLNAAPVQHIGKLLVVYRPKKEKTSAGSDDKLPRSTRETRAALPKKGAVRSKAGKGILKGNERMTVGGKIKRAKTRQTSAKKKSLA